jgi:uncharacterized membrane protein
MASASTERALKLAVVTGLRAMLGPALVSHSQHRPERHNLALAALGEMVFDKLPGVPGRDTLLPLIARGAAGAWVAAKCVEEDGERADPWAVPLGAAVAMGVAVAAPKIRRTLGWTTGIPQPILGLIEDYLALKLGTETLGLSLNDVTEAAKESVDDLRDRARQWELPEVVRPLAQSVGAGSM